ncbi:hypothetical protein MTR67_022302 [Solanum verrucosum]|uniref:Uncharacterized protein n=1 Tax=Solanum verrucosum TaxID=315347 RepID=A0AAF0QRL9_SOLVR|nr:hypothetical protein MTR67_022302 [Solanum verrucosum]
MHNKCLLMKWLWRYGQNEAGYWKEIIKAKHGIHDHWRPKMSKDPHGVGVWKHLSSFQNEFFQKVYFKPGNGLNIRFWLDKWIGGTILKDSLPMMFQIATNKEATMAQYRVDNIWSPIFRRN